MIELNYLRAFNTVAQFQSFTKASKQLHISQPALSIQIKKLEATLGLNLFYKSHNMIFLTESGLLLYEYTQKIFALVDEVDIKLSKNRVGNSKILNIGGNHTSGTYILPEIIAQYKTMYPSVNINLHVTNNTELSQLIEAGTLDFTINGGSIPYSQNISAEKILEDELVLVASPHNAICSKKYLSVEDVKKLCFIVHQIDSQLYVYYHYFIDELEIPEKIGMNLAYIDAIKQTVCANLGVTLLPLTTVSHELAAGQLQRLRIKNRSWSYPYYLVYPKNRPLSTTAQNFITLIKNSSLTHKPEV